MSRGGCPQRVLAYVCAILYNLYMKIITITNARKNIASLVDRVKYQGEIFGIGRHHSIDALLIQFPHTYNKNLSEITNINAYSRSFDFLESEPELYSFSDLKKEYV